MSAERRTCQRRTSTHTEEVFQDDPKMLNDLEKQSLYTRPVYIEKAPMSRIMYRPPKKVPKICEYNIHTHACTNTQMACIIREDV